MKVTTDSCLFGAWVAAQIKNQETKRSVLDIGCGSGLLSLMIAQQSILAIEGVEIQQNDYLQCLDNISGSPFKEGIIIHHVDALKFHYDKKFDIIISNPPFYEQDLKGKVTGKNIAHHDEGLKLPELLHIIACQLNADGNFYLLLPDRRLPQLQQLVSKAGLFINELVRVHQTENHGPFRIMVRGSFIEDGLQEYKMIIKDGNDYSAPFRELLKNYYLYL